MLYILYIYYICIYTQDVSCDCEQSFFTRVYVYMYVYAECLGVNVE